MTAASAAAFVKERLEVMTRLPWKSLQLERDFLDLPGEPEGRVVGEVDGRPDVLADVEAFADRQGRRDRPREPAFADLPAIHEERNDGGFADFLRAALVDEVHLDLDLTAGQRGVASHGRTLDREEVVDERRPALADVEPDPAFESSIRDDHPLDARGRYVHVGRDRPRLVEYPRRGVRRHADLSRVVGQCPGIPRQAGTSHRLGVEALGRAPVEGKNAVLPGFGPPEVLQLFELLRVRG